ncbi:unnamed protein product [Lactuca virosa]|uniref:DUF7811 domain-containing protein n=1 Tax=Lactuca virosa TaxID=75947 RepID=A0AAU9NVJ2_9ASTR|nr:unnamed protein product [Lactuca virosa]
MSFHLLHPHFSIDSLPIVTHSPLNPVPFHSPPNHPPILPAISLLMILLASILGSLLVEIVVSKWEQQETITLFTSDGLVQIGGLMVPKRVPSAHKKQSKVKTSPRFQQYKESNYMDPAQGLCLGALFDIAATNGLDMGRRLCIIGFCRSIEMLSDIVEDTVLEHGGEVVVAEKASKGGLNEKLTMTVAVPLLWGVPPASESLQIAVKSGGGIVDKVFWQWNLWLYGVMKV